MGKKTAAQIIADNLKSLIELHKLSNESLGVRAKIGSSTIGRLRHAENSSRIDNIEAVAAAFGLEVWQFLIPDVDTASPPRLESDGAQRAPGAINLTEEERALIHAFRSLDAKGRGYLIADAQKYGGTTPEVSTTNKSSSRAA